MIVFRLIAMVFFSVSIGMGAAPSSTGGLSTTTIILYHLAAQVLAALAFLALQLRHSLKQWGILPDENERALSRQKLQTGKWYEATAYSVACYVSGILILNYHRVK